MDWKNKIKLSFLALGVVCLVYSIFFALTQLNILVSKVTNYPSTTDQIIMSIMNFIVALYIAYILSIKKLEEVSK